MAHVLCMTHAGIRCGIPAQHIAVAQRPIPSEDCIELWADATPHGAATDSQRPRAIQVLTPHGALWLLVSRARMVSMTSGQLLELPPLLTELLGCPYIVGVAVVDAELVWLVDPRRYVPAEQLRINLAG